MTYTTRRERRQAEKLQAKQLRNRRLAAGGASLSIIIGATLASSSAAVAAPVSTVTSSSAATTTTYLNMRSGPGVSKSVVSVLRPSARVTPTGKSSGSWVQVTASGRTGWVHSAYLTTGSTSTRTTTGSSTTSSASGSAATTTALNMRSGPGVSNSVITVLSRNASVSRLGQSSGSWVKIKAAGRTGWVHGSYLTSRSTGTSTTSSARTVRAATSSTSTSSTSSNASPLRLQLASATSPSSWRTAAASWARTKANSAGVYYTWGGNGPTGYDCSGFTSGAYSAAGKSLPRTSRAQYTSADSRVSLGNLQAGDLVFWSNNGAASGIYHVAVYIGDGKIAHARNPQMGVKVTDLHYSPTNMMGTAARYN